MSIAFIRLDKHFILIFFFYHYFILIWPLKLQVSIWNIIYFCHIVRVLLVIPCSQEKVELFLLAKEIFFYLNKDHASA